MTADTPDSVMHAIPPDRRPAIWPWLVMPLITLAVFYWLYSQDPVAGPRSHGGAHGGEPAASAEADTSSTP